LGVDIQFLADDQGSPAAELQGAVLRGESFWVDVRVQDVRDGQSQGVIALPLNLSWDPTLFQFDGDANLTPEGRDPLPIDDPLVTSDFPLQRAVASFDAAAGAFDPTADPNTLLDFFNLRGVRGGALPNFGQGQAIGAGTAESFSQLRFTAIANSSAAPFTVNLDGSMSFADGDPLEDVSGIGNTVDVAALANTVMATTEIVGGSINGTKFNDADGDGVRDAGESGVPGISIILTPTNPPGTAQNVETGGDGSYTFGDLTAGMYTVSEIVPNNSLLTTPMNNSHMVILAQGNETATDLDFGNFNLVTLSGTKFNDANENRIRDPGELGVAGVTIRLDLNNDGDTTNDPAQVTAADGTYQFVAVSPGTHALSEDVPTGFHQTLPTSGGYTVTMVSGQDQTDLDFGNAVDIVATVSGTKFSDVNGNGMLDTGEPGVPGVTIQLDINNDGTDIRQTMTDANGAFEFIEVPSGTHAVSEVLPAGTVRTTPAVDPVIVTVNHSSSVTGLLFGNFQTTSLSGLSFNDLNQDGNFDTGEPVLPNVTIQLNLDNDGDPTNDLTQVTGADGRYQFNNVGPGTHSVRELVPSGLVPTLPNPARYVIVNQSGESRTDLDFGNRIIDTGSSISGLVYSDVNRDGRVDPGEVGLPGVTVQAFLDGAATATQTTTTAADGSYLFASLAAGTYRVVETQPVRFNDASITLGTVLPSGETRGTTDGLNAFNDITLDGQETAIDYNFGEVLAAVSKRMFLASMNVRAELTANAGLREKSLVGTSGDDQIRVEHLANNRLSVTINNGAPIEFSADEAQIVLVDALGGQDSMTVVGSDQNEQIRTSPSQVAFTTPTQMLGVFNVERILVEGGGGVDTAILRDSAAADQLNASGNSAVLSSPAGQRIELVEVDTIDAVSAVDNNRDRANIQAIDFVLRLSGDWQ
jgi:hypothetical protein